MVDVQFKMFVATVDHGGVQVLDSGIRGICLVLDRLLCQCGAMTAAHCQACCFRVLHVCHGLRSLVAGTVGS